MGTLPDLLLRLVCLRSRCHRFCDHTHMSSRHETAKANLKGSAKAIACLCLTLCLHHRSGSYLQVYLARQAQQIATALRNVCGISALLHTQLDTPCISVSSSIGLTTANVCMLLQTVRVNNNIEFLTFTLASLEMTPLPLQGASNSALSMEFNPNIFGSSLPS